MRINRVNHANDAPPLLAHPTGALVRARASDVRQTSTRRTVGGPTSLARPGFFTVNLAQRRANALLVHHLAAPRDAFRYVKATHPVDMDAVVVLPDHLHCI